MICSTLRSLVGVLALSKTAAGYTASSTSEETVTAPVDFVWPEERPWYVDYQNESPCGTNASVNDRTEFPLDSGVISLAIAGNAYSVAFRVAYMNDPTSQSDFTTEIVHTSEVQAGHQCYSAPAAPSTVVAGTNATIQLEYTAQYNGSAYEIFYACADITFVETSAFTTDVSCFNTTVTGASDDPFVSSASSSASATSTSSASSHDLTTASKVGIAVGVAVGSFALLAGLSFVLLRKRVTKKQKDSEAMFAQNVKQVDDGSSFTTAETAK